MTETRNTIRGKVARVLNSRELALNIGRDDGVQVGMTFAVLDPKGEDIEDPDTGEILGSLILPKVLVRVKDVQHRLSVAETFRRKRVNIGGKGTSLGTFSEISEYLLPPKWIEKYETFRTDEKAWEDLSEDQSYVQPGDPVRQIIETENPSGSAESGTKEVVAE